jgi:UDP-N-acetylmuramyl pentapeptide phosphotransferase/UDP-N-acetylglucosamine-1-phosphate transferase
MCGAVVGAVGLYDDLEGSSSDKGLRGHLSALSRGEVTSGSVKIGVIGATGLVGAALVSDNLVDTLIGGAAIAGHANVMNLLDLRPGRAIKAGFLQAPLALGGPAGPVAGAGLGAAAALLGDDLAERSMLGDAGANALGSVLGLAMVAREGRAARLVHLAAVTGLTLASEKVSFTKVIAKTPVLRELDELGRRPPEPTS